MNPTDLRLREYDDNCFWFMEENGTITVGITQKGIDQLTSIQDLELSEIGDEAAERDWIGEIFGANSSVEIFAPCAFRITEVNPEVLNQPSFLEDDPTGDAWLIRGEKTES